VLIWITIRIQEFLMEFLPLWEGRKMVRISRD